MAADKPPKTLREAIVYFSDYDHCHEAVSAIRWPDGVVRCPTCGSDNVTYLATQRRFKCYAKHPRAQFSLKVGTLFEDSAIGLEKWLPALWLLVNCKNGISSYELARALGVTQKTAWFMLSRLRLALHADNGGKLGGEVEVDETFIGGKARNMHKAKRKAMIESVGAKREYLFGQPINALANKVTVLGMLERGADGTSKVRTMAVSGTKRHQLQSKIRENVEEGTALYTDSLRSYRQMNDYSHQFIDHATEYVRGNVHTNGMESYWSLLKRALHGT